MIDSERYNEDRTGVNEEPFGTCDYCGCPDAVDPDTGICADCGIDHTPDPDRDYDSRFPER